MPTPRRHETVAGRAGQLFIPLLLELWRQGRFPVDRIIETFPFEQINEAADAAHSGRVIKPVLTMS